MELIEAHTFNILHTTIREADKMLDTLGIQSDEDAVRFRAYLVRAKAEAQQTLLDMAATSRRAQQAAQDGK